MGKHKSIYVKQIDSSYLELKEFKSLLGLSDSDVKLLTDNGLEIYKAVISYNRYKSKLYVCPVTTYEYLKRLTNGQSLHNWLDNNRA